jgi:hypothetical protein
MLKSFFNLFRKTPAAPVSAPVAPVAPAIKLPAPDSAYHPFSIGDIAVVGPNISGSKHAWSGRIVRRSEKHTGFDSIVLEQVETYSATKQETSAACSYRVGGRVVADHRFDTNSKAVVPLRFNVELGEFRNNGRFVDYGDLLLVKFTDDRKVFGILKPQD